MPQASVAPAPRSHTRKVISSGPRTSAKDTLARSGNIGWRSNRGPSDGRSTASASGTKKTACGLPMLIAAGACSPVPRMPSPRSRFSVSAASRSGMSRQPKRGGPMSTVKDSGPSRRHDTAVPSTSSATASPLPVSAGLSSMMNQATQREPLPQAPARDPSVLKIRTAASTPAPSDSTIICSKASGPRHRARAASPVRLGVVPRSSTTRMELPAPFILA